VRPKDRGLAQKLDAGLHSFEKQKHPLPGIQPRVNREALLEQLVESIHRINYISVIRTREISDLRADPSSDLFDALKAAVLRQRQGQLDEAFWLVFMSVHFGKHRRTGWRLARDIYGCLGGSAHWDWARTSPHPERFRKWLAAHQSTLRGGDGIARHFGNHRKYQSLDAWSSKGTGEAVESYVRWVRPYKNHQTLIQNAQNQAGGGPRKTFDYLYRSMREVVSFGRTARFDYLTMVGKLGLASIEPGSTYMQGATGPLKGARLLFGGSTTGALRRLDLDAWLVELDAHLEVGMQVLEDALCNWQKAPENFKGFRG
jgi:Alpha-glutamyl/putrescinyl thymine pyrophosphorylase clade 3